MKLIKAYIGHRKTEDVYNALKNAGYSCMTLSDCEGTVRDSKKEREHISDRYPFAKADLMVKMEIVVELKDVKKIVQLIRLSGRTGYNGDGMIIVSAVDRFYQIRTDDKGYESV